MIFYIYSPRNDAYIRLRVFARMKIRALLLFPSININRANSSRLSHRGENKYGMDKASLSFHRGRNIDAIVWKTTRSGTNRISISVVIVSGVLVVEAWLRLNFPRSIETSLFPINPPDFLPARRRPETPTELLNVRVHTLVVSNGNYVPFFYFFSFFQTINQNATRSFTLSFPSFPFIHRSSNS